MLFLYQRHLYLSTGTSNQVPITRNSIQSINDGRHGRNDGDRMETAMAATLQSSHPPRQKRVQLCACVDLGLHLVSCCQG